MLSCIEVVERKNLNSGGEDADVFCVELEAGSGTASALLELSLLILSFFFSRSRIAILGGWPGPVDEVERSCCA